MKCAYCKKQTVQLIADQDAPTEWQEWMTGRTVYGEDEIVEDEIVVVKRHPIIESKLCYYHNKVLVGLFGIDKMNNMKREMFFK